MSAFIEYFAKLAPEKSVSWMNESLKTFEISELKVLFVMAHRFIPKQEIEMRQGEKPIDLLILGRIILLKRMEELSDRENFKKTVDFLFDQAEIQEAKAIVKGLVEFNHPEDLVEIGRKAVRSNTGDIFDAFAFGNSYAKIYFDENSWNQLVLKCIFNLKPIHQIQGLRERSNQSLANTLSDFAHERWAAGRGVPPYVWCLMIGFLNDHLLKDIYHLITEGNREDKMAGYLVLREERFLPAQKLFTDFDFPDERSEWNWKILENYV